MSGPPAGPAVHYTGDLLTDLKAERNAVAPPKDRVLWDYRIATVALRREAYDEAKNALDDAIRIMGGLLAGPDDAARRARSLFAAESEKTFVGEPYERAMAYIYRGMLYWRDGEADNARACFRSAELADSYTEDRFYRADWVLPDYLDGLATLKLGGDGSDAFARAEQSAQRKLPPYRKDANVLIFCEYDLGPEKYAGGAGGAQLHFRADPPQVRSARLVLGDQIVSLLPWDDVVFQATTRGGRVMDYILGRKVVFQQSASTIGDAALTGAVIAMGQDGNRRSEGKAPQHEEAAVAMAAIGLISKGIASATQTHADTRSWVNLPRSLSFAALALPPGDYPATVEFLDQKDDPQPRRTQHLTVQVTGEGGDTVVFLSEFAKKPVPSVNPDPSSVVQPRNRQGL
ncbi:MAG: hypothetical protein PHQ04_03825 [Opitutaceae bacterium]|nr:hypothetical protein [Opitutaceae bacterium]